MVVFSNICQVTIALSIFFVWGVRRENIAHEFKHFGYSDRFRNGIGILKTSLALLLILGFWIPEVVVPAAFGMSILMLGAQWTHFRVKNPFPKRAPSLLLLSLCIVVILEKLNNGKLI